MKLLLHIACAFSIPVVYLFFAWIILGTFACLINWTFLYYDPKYWYPLVRFFVGMIFLLVSWFAFLYLLTEAPHE